MGTIKIDADALFRAVTATGYKLLAYHLNLGSGEITSRTLRPDEVAAPPQGPSVKPLPKMGGDLAPKKDAAPFGPLPVAQPKKDLFGDDGQKKPAFGGDFWKRDDKKKPDIFGDGGFQRESGTKKLAEIFGGPPAKKKHDPFAKGDSAPAAPSPAPVIDAAPEDPTNPRIPAVTEAQQQEWMHAFAKDFGDPEIRDQMYAALKNAKPLAAFEKTLRKHQRAGQQWERYFRKQALAFGEAWLSERGVQWELEEKQ